MVAKNMAVGKSSLTQRQVRIVHVLTDGELGGAQRSTQWLVGAVDRARFDLFFIFLYSGGPTCDAIAAMGYPVEVLHWKNGYSLGGRIQLVRLLRRIEPDIIHDHDATPFSRVWMRAAVRCPIVSTQHGSFLNRDAGWLRLFFIRLDDRITDLVIANSAFTSRAHSRLYRRPMLAIRTIHLGLDLEGFASSEQVALPPEAGMEGAVRIAFVGRLEIHKGVLQLPTLARALCRRGFVDFEVLVVGDGPARESCSHTAHELGVDQHFTYLGWRTDVSHVLRQADVLVLPSLKESFGLVPLEALAAGLPVVAYDVGGVREALASAPGAHLVPVGEVESMADAVIAAVHERGECSPDAGLEYVRARFDVRRTAREIEEVYMGLMAHV
jgi:glycosyltransferase involved in cell wall biosynthesis